MAVEQTEVKTILLTGPITLYEVSAVRETLRMALAEGSASDRSERFGTVGLGRPAAPGLLREDRAQPRSGGTLGQRPEDLRRNRRAIGIVGMAPLGPRVKTFEVVEGLGHELPSAARAVRGKGDHVRRRRWKGLSRDIVRRGT